MRVRDILFRNFWWKLASVVLATLIWFNGSEVYRTDDGSNLRTKTLSLTVRPVANSADVHNFICNPTEVNVTLEGESSDLKRVDPKAIYASVYVPNTEMTSPMSLPVGPPVGGANGRGLPPGVKVVSIRPEKVTVRPPSEP